MTILAYVTSNAGTPGGTVSFFDFYGNLVVREPTQPGLWQQRRFSHDFQLASRDGQLTLQYNGDDPAGNYSGSTALMAFEVN